MSRSGFRLSPPARWYAANASLCFSNNDRCLVEQILHERVRAKNHPAHSRSDQLLLGLVVGTTDWRLRMVRGSQSLIGNLHSSMPDDEFASERSFEPLFQILFKP
jgi:hypothetical protein